MKFVFHHIPKTGGHSVVQSFREVYGYQSVDVDRGPNILVTSHQPSETLFDAYPDRTHLTILRDPVERVLSYVRYMKGTSDNHVAEWARMLPTDVFLRIDWWEINEMVDNRIVRQLGGDYTNPASPAVYDKATANLDRFAWIGHTRTLTADIDRLFKDLVEQPNPALPPQNKSKHSADNTDPELLAELTWWDRLLYEPLA